MPKSKLKYDEEGVAVAPKLPFELPAVPESIEEHHTHEHAAHGEHHHHAHHAHHAHQESLPKDIAIVE